MKKIILTLFLSLALASFSQTFNGLKLSCYQMGINNAQTEFRLACDLEICITQDIECPSCPSNPAEHNPSNVTRIVTCSTISSTFGALSPVCFWENDPSASQECPCTVIYSAITIKRISTGETITVPSSDVPTVLSLISNPSGGAISLPAFQLDCNGHLFPNSLTLGTLTGIPMLVLNEH